MRRYVSCKHRRLAITPATKSPIAQLKLTLTLQCCPNPHLERTRAIVCIVKTSADHSTTESRIVEGALCSVSLVREGKSLGGGGGFGMPSGRLVVKGTVHNTIGICCLEHQQAVNVRSFVHTNPSKMASHHIALRLAHTSSIGSRVGVV